MQKVNEETAPRRSEVVVEKDNSLKAEPSPVEMEEDGYLAVVDGQWTDIFDEDRERIDRFWAQLSRLEFRRYVQGLRTGLKLGKEYGSTAKAAEIRQVLGL